MRQERKRQIVIVLNLLGSAVCLVLVAGAFSVPTKAMSLYIAARDRALKELHQRHPAGPGDDTTLAALEALDSCSLVPDHVDLDEGEPLALTACMSRLLDDNRPALRVAADLHKEFWAATRAYMISVMARDDSGLPPLNASSAAAAVSVVPAYTPDDSRVQVSSTSAQTP